MLKRALICVLLVACNGRAEELPPLTWGPAVPPAPAPGAGISSSSSSTSTKTTKDVVTALCSQLQGCGIPAELLAQCSTVWLKSLSEVTLPDPDGFITCMAKLSCNQLLSNQVGALATACVAIKSVACQGESLQVCGATKCTLVDCRKWCTDQKRPFRGCVTTQPRDVPDTQGTTVTGSCSCGPKDATTSNQPQ